MVGQSIVDCFFASPLPLLLGAVSGKICENRWAAVQCSSGGMQTHYRRGDGLLPSPHTELCLGKDKMKIFEGLSKSKNMVFNVKKL